MKRFLKYLVLTALLTVFYIMIIFLGTDKGWWHKPFTNEKEPIAFEESVQAKLQNEYVGNLAMAVFENGVLAKESFHSKGKAVDRNTVFQVASLAKFVSAIGVMRLVQQGALDLEAPVSQYLNRWHLPEGEFDNNGVTIRRLLSHTAGLTDGLGYGGFKNPKDVQSLEASLTSAQDVDPGRDGIIKVGVLPGNEWRYSGGGFTILQLLVEEVSGKTFDAFMRTEIFEPLQMTSSFYQWDETFGSRLSTFYQEDGTVAAHHFYTAQAASGLYTTLADLEKLFYFLSEDHNHQNPLYKKSLKRMWQVEAKSFGAPIYGLGTLLFTEIENGVYIIGHDGKNDPPINTAFRYNPISKSGIIILTTGSRDIATRIASDWVFIQTGKVDALLFVTQQDKMIQTMVFGCIVILILAISIGLITRSQQILKSNK